MDDPFKYIECIASSDRDPDVQGYAVRLSVFIANVCLAILVTWSHEDVLASVCVIFVQVHTLLLATFISLARHKLSVADAHFCLTLTISPLAIYFIYSTTRWYFNKRSNLYIRLGKSHTLISVLTVMMVIEWLILPVLIYLAPEYIFEDSEPCSLDNLEEFVAYRTFRIMQWMYLSFLLFPLFPFFYIVYTLRHVFDIAREHRRHQNKVTPWRFFRFVQVPWLFVRSWTLSNWIVVTYSHQWMIFLLVFIAYLSWAGGVGIWIPSMPDYWQGVLDAVQVLRQKEAAELQSRADEADEKWDALGFGQLLAATSALQPLYEVCKLAIRQRHELWHTVASYPRSFWNGVVFLVTGHRNSWKKILKEREAREVEEAEALPLRKHNYSNSMGDSNDDDTVCLVRPEYSTHQSSGSYSMPYPGDSPTPDYHAFTQ